MPAKKVGAPYHNRAKIFQMSTDAAVRRARKNYRCMGGPDHVCNVEIKIGDVYFAFTIHTPNGHRTNRYCVECGHKNHPELLKQSLKDVRSPAKRKAAGRRVGKMSFLEARSRYMKKNATVPEQLLWDKLKGNSLSIRFHQQFMLHGYIVDFWAPQKKLVIEVDGRRHHVRKEQDAKRDEMFRSHGIYVLRIPAQLLYADLNYAIEMIRERIRILAN
jgi:very-short-patch-repair endonuclease